VYATVYENDASLIAEGLSVTVKLSSKKNEEWHGIVRGLNPTLDAMTRSLMARIELDNVNVTLKPNTYVDVYFEIDLGNHLTIPKSALIETGERKIAYVIHDDEQFLAHDIAVLDEAGDNVIVASGLSEGDTVATNATFLIDSESQLRGNIQTEHQH
jgi:Cu(I)/Ag(I) efflux system membrane fusion protein